MVSASNIQTKWVHLSEGLWELKNSLQKEFEYMTANNRHPSELKAKKNQIEKLETVLEIDYEFFSALTALMQKEYRTAALCKMIKFPITFVEAWDFMDQEQFHEYITGPPKKQTGPKVNHEAFLSNLKKDMVHLEAGKLPPVRISELNEFRTGLKAHAQG